MSARQSRRETTEGRVTTASAWIVSLIFVIVGGILLYASGTPRVVPRQTLSAFLSQLGGLVLGSGLLTFAWDLFGRRAFADEVLAKAKLSTDVVQSGITRVTDQYLDNVEWVDLFRDVHKLDIVVAYASTWRNSQRSRLIEAAKEAGGRIRVFLPDYRDAQTMAILADRFSITPQEVASRVQSAVSDFGFIKQPGGASVDVLLRKGDALFSCYRFDSRAVLTLYSHSRERRTQVPTFVVTGGDLFQFVYRELGAIEQQSHLAP